MLSETLANFPVSVYDNYKLTLRADEELKRPTIDQKYWNFSSFVKPRSVKIRESCFVRLYKMYVAYRHYLVCISPKELLLGSKYLYFACFGETSFVSLP